MKITKRRLRKLIREFLLVEQMTVPTRMFYNSQEIYMEDDEETESGEANINEALAAGAPGTDTDDFKNLQPGDRLTLNGAPIIVIEADVLYATIVYVNQGKSVRKEFDYRLASIYPDEPEDLLPELDVVYLGPGPAPKNTRRAPKKKGPGISYSVHD